MINAVTPEPIVVHHDTTEVSDFAKRLVAASSLGIYIQQENGHRYITIDMREFSYRFPEAMGHEDFQCVNNVQWGSDAVTEPLFQIKEYGSFASALNRIDRYIFPETLVGIFASLNYADTIVGTGDVE